MNSVVWIFCLTAANDIVGVTSIGDTRWEGSEGGRESGFHTKLPISTWIPSDPLISKLVVYESVIDLGNWKLKKIGEVSAKVTEEGN